MKFLCDQCKTRYSIGDDRVRGKILKIRCKNCANVITVREGMRRGADASRRDAPPTTATQAHAADRRRARARRRVLPIAEAAAALEEEWYVSIDGVQSGPFSLTDAQRWVASKPFEAELHCWSEGFDDWLPVDKVSHFRNLRKKPAPRQRQATAPPPIPQAEEQAAVRSDDGVAREGAPTPARRCRRTSRAQPTARAAANVRRPRADRSRQRRVGCVPRLDGTARLADRVLVSRPTTTRAEADAARSAAVRRRSRRRPIVEALPAPVTPIHNDDDDDLEIGEVVARRQSRRPHAAPSPPSTREPARSHGPDAAHQQPGPSRARNAGASTASGGDRDSMPRIGGRTGSTPKLIAERARHERRSALAGQRRRAACRREHRRALVRERASRAVSSLLIGVSGRDGRSASCRCRVRRQRRQRRGSRGGLGGTRADRHVASRGHRAPRSCRRRPTRARLRDRATSDEAAIRAHRHGATTQSPTSRIRAATRCRRPRSRTWRRSRARARSAATCARRRARSASRSPTSRRSTVTLTVSKDGAVTDVARCRRTAATRSVSASSRASRAGSSASRAAARSASRSRSATS